MTFFCLGFLPFPHVEEKGVEQGRPAGDVTLIALLTAWANGMDMFQAVLLFSCGFLVLAGRQLPLPPL